MTKQKSIEEKVKEKIKNLFRIGIVERMNLWLGF